MKRRPSRRRQSQAMRSVQVAFGIIFKTKAFSFSDHGRRSQGGQRDMPPPTFRSKGRSVSSPYFLGDLLHNGCFSIPIKRNKFTNNAQ